MGKLRSYVTQAGISLRSKLTRWARDVSSNKYGFNSANDLARYMDKNPEAVKELLK
jgi:predicted nicotinamide N-methyase